MLQQQPQQQQQERQHFAANEDSNSHVFEAFKVARAILRDAVHPLKVHQFYLRSYLRRLGLWPSPWSFERPIYYISNVLIMVLLHVFVVTTACDLYVVNGDIVLLGEDLVMVLGLCLILFKVWFTRWYSTHLDSFVAEFQTLHMVYSRHPWQLHHEQMRHYQRTFFLVEFVVFVSFLVIAGLLCTTVCLHPFFTGNAVLPFRAQFPYHFGDHAYNPHGYVIVYIFQCCCLAYMLFAIVVMDMLGSEVIGQITLNLRILCLRIRQLGWEEQQQQGHWQQREIRERRELGKELHELIQMHQRIISISENINRIYYWNYVSQMGASTFMICLTAFEVLLAEDEPLVAVKFLMYMIAAFSQLFYWCYVGNVTYFESSEVATATFQLYEWYEQKTQFQHDLMFMLKRAQKPLEFRPKPFPAFNFVTFSKILRLSYSYLTLLRTMAD